MKKECENLALYFYGELDAPRAADFKAHLQTCAGCRRELELMRLTQEALVPPAAPQELVERVWAGGRKPALWRWARTAAAAAVLAGVCVYAFVAGPGLRSADDGGELTAYISAVADAEYNRFVMDFESFENEF